MKTSRYTGLIALSIACTLAACTQPAPPPAPVEAAAAPAPPPPPPPAPPPPAPVGKADPFALADLTTGMEAMSLRIVATEDGFEKVAPRADARFSLHPDAEKSASIEFDLVGLTSLTLSPFIADFSSSQDCMGNPDAGVVRMVWTLDGGAPNEVNVDRDYTAPIEVATGGAKRLKVVVDKGNAVHWCDWFGLGVVNVK